MAASCTKYDYYQNSASFVVSTDAEVSKLPTTSSSGTDELAYMKPVCHGSDCLSIATSSVFILDGDNDTWTQIK